jgi:phosphoesterase RecJ-like protein
MDQKIIELINAHNKIIITRHKDPDLDAYGSQFGLYYALKHNFPDKEIYVTGDVNGLNRFKPMDIIEPSLYSEALVFILDTVAKQMLEGSLYEQAKMLVLIDHHQNNPDIRYDYYIRNTEASSCAEIIARLLIDNEWVIPTDSATALYTGIVSDTGRFLYKSVTASTFEVAAKLINLGIDIQSIYAQMYSESLSMKRLKAVFFSTVEFTPRGIAYRKNDAEFLKKYNIDTYSVSRGMVNQMSGIDEVPIWANFTYEEKTGRILCELRSKIIPIVDIAKKYGGGGHLLACGCNVATWEETDLIINDLDKLLEEYHG